MRRHLIVIVSICAGMIAFPLYGQEGELQAHWEISVPISYNLNDRWSMNTTFTSRTGFYDAPADDEATDWFVNFVEATQYVTYRLGINSSITLGYRRRQENPFEGEEDYENRLIQQFGLVHINQVFRLASRLQNEQRWTSDSFSQRVRYRISLDRPLSGEKLDLGEFYGIVSNELVAEFNEGSTNTLENRISFGLGNKWRQRSKVQVDVQFRTEDVFDRSITELFIMTGFYFKLN